LPETTCGEGRGGVYPLWAVTEVSNARQLEVDISSRRVFDPCWDVKGTENATEGETEGREPFSADSWTAGTVGGTIIGSRLVADVEVTGIDPQSVASNVDSDDLFFADSSRSAQEDKYFSIAV
jgi:hypothetical protein